MSKCIGCIRIEAISIIRSHEPVTAPWELPQKKEGNISGVRFLESHLHFVSRLTTGDLAGAEQFVYVLQRKVIVALNGSSDHAPDF